MKIKKTGWASVLLVASSLVALNASALTRNLDYNDDDNGLVGSGDAGSFSNSYDSGASVSDRYDFASDGVFSGDLGIDLGTTDGEVPAGFDITNMKIEVFRVDGGGDVLLASDNLDDDALQVSVLFQTGQNYYLLVTGDATGAKGGSYTGNYAVAAVPLPAAVWLFGSALAGLAVVRRRKVAAA